MSAFIREKTEKKLVRNAKKNMLLFGNIFHQKWTIKKNRIIVALTAITLPACIFWRTKKLKREKFRETREFFTRRNQTMKNARIAKCKKIKS